jgi:hypothetical protein
VERSRHIAGRPAAADFAIAVLEHGDNFAILFNVTSAGVGEGLAWRPLGHDACWQTIESNHVVGGSAVDGHANAHSPTGDCNDLFNLLNLVVLVLEDEVAAVVRA